MLHAKCEYFHLEEKHIPHVCFDPCPHWMTHQSTSSENKSPSAKVVDCSPYRISRVHSTQFLVVFMSFLKFPSTLKTPNKGKVDTSTNVHYSEAVLYWGVLAKILF